MEETNNSFDEDEASNHSHISDETNETETEIETDDKDQVENYRASIEFDRNNETAINKKEIASILMNLVNGSQRNTGTYSSQDVEASSPGFLAPFVSNVDDNDVGGPNHSTAVTRNDESDDFDPYLPGLERRQRNDQGRQDDAVSPRGNILPSASNGNNNGSITIMAGDIVPDNDSNNDASDPAVGIDEVEVEDDLPAAPYLDGGDDDSVIMGVIVPDAKQNKKLKLIGVLLMFTIVVVIILATYFSMNRSPPSTPLSSKLYSDYIKEILIPISGEDKLEDPSTIQNFAWHKVSYLEFVVMQNPDLERSLVQSYITYVVGVVLFGTGGRLFDLTSTGYKFGDECNFFRCNENMEITHITAKNMKVTHAGGTIPLEIGFLPKLEVLVLQNNGIEGTLPTQIGKLMNLRLLNVENNNLSGTIPTELGQLKKMDWMMLNKNNMSSSIPSEIGKMSVLRFVDFADNVLTGTVPSELGNFTDLLGMEMHGNNLTGNLNFLCNKQYLNRYHEVWRNDYMGLLIDCNNDLLTCHCCTCK